MIGKVVDVFAWVARADDLAFGAGSGLESHLVGVVKEVLIIHRSTTVLVNVLYSLDLAGVPRFRLSHVGLLVLHSCSTCLDELSDHVPHVLFALIDQQSVAVGVCLLDAVLCHMEPDFLEQALRL